MSEGNGASAAAAGDARPERGVVYDRTSKDEASGQDPAAQLADTLHRARVAGFVVADEDVFGDSDVSGDSLWTEREGLQAALARARERGAVLVVREVSRLSRFRPEVGLALIGGLAAPVIDWLAREHRLTAVLEARDLGGIQDLTVLGKAQWERREGRWVNDDDGSVLLRDVDLWSTWGEKRRAVERSRAAIEAIMEGRRPTRTGRRPGREKKDIDPEHVEAARRILAKGGSLNDAREHVRALRGYYAVKDPDAKKRRDVGKGTLGRALGLKGYEPRGRAAAQNGDRPKTPVPQGAAIPAGSQPSGAGGSGA